MDTSLRGNAYLQRDFRTFDAVLDGDTRFRILLQLQINPANFALRNQLQRCFDINRTIKIRLL